MKFVNSILFGASALARVYAFNLEECQSRACTVKDVSFKLDSSYTNTGSYSIIDNSITLRNSESPRLYLMNNDKYEKLKLLGRQLQFDIDISTLPCGSNGALYFIDTDSAYCDAQTAGGLGCNEMDVYEGNSNANAFTSHSCKNSECDKSGCGVNTKTFESPLLVDMAKPFTVITQFIETNGELSTITRKYKQNNITYEGGSLYSCDNNGGFATMSKSLSTGMVMAISIWGGSAYDMEWLDGCKKDSYDYTAIKNARVTFSNIIISDIGEDSSSIAPAVTEAATFIKLNCTLA